MASLWPLNLYAQGSGVGLNSMVATGYGLYAVTMKPSAQPGTISSFYLYSNSGAWPARWHEIDLEFTPGFQGSGQIDDPFNPHILALGTGCFAANTQDNLPVSQDDCQLQAVPKNTGINTYLSFDVYSHRAWSGYQYQGKTVYPHSNGQVFMPADSGAKLYTQAHTFLIYYTPNGVYWSKDLPVTPLASRHPPSRQLLKSPIAFVKKDTHVVNANPLWSPKDHDLDVPPGSTITPPDFPLNQAFVYDRVPLTPLLEDKHTLAETGTLMYLSMNLWDGSCSGTKGCGDPTAWGGPYLSPSAHDTSEYVQVAFYPLTTPVRQAATALDPRHLSYDKPALFSDFQHGLFLVNQKTISFAKLWHVSDGHYLYPLGALDERNLSCGHGPLTMKMHAYPTPRASDDRQGLESCPWLLDNLP